MARGTQRSLGDYLELQPGSPRWTVLVAGVSIAVAGVAFFLIAKRSYGDLNCPPQSAWHDDVFYDNIAWCQANGKGFAHDWPNETWRADYQTGTGTFWHGYKHHGKTTNRNPGFPTVAATIYKMFGRRFDLVRTLNIAMMAIAVGISATLAYRFAGWVAAIIVVLISIIDGEVSSTASLLMTEPMAAFLFTVAVALLIGAVRPSNIGDDQQTRRWGIWITVGLVWGMLTLTRASFALWIPVALVLLGSRVLLRRRKEPSADAHEVALSKPLTACLVTVLVISPWCVRNCLLTGGFEPLGCLGSTSLAGAYCDASMDEWGNWQIEPQREVVRRTSKEFPRGLSLPQQERALGQACAQQAFNWMRENPGKLPYLAIMRVISHLNLRQLAWVPWYLYAANVGLMSMAFVGLLQPCTLSRVARWVVLIDLLVVMLTWSHYGRFLIPLRPMIYALAAIGVITCLRFDLWLLNKVSRKRIVN